MNDLNNLHSDEPIGFVRQLLLLVSRGHVAIAELHRLADLVPEVFRLSNRADQQRYSDLLPDFTYFANVDQFERRIEQQASLQKVDEELRSNYGDLLQQFYSLFERIQQYVFDLRRLLDEIDGSDHVHQTLEMMLSDFEGRQLLCESVYVCGLLLFILDFKLCGPLRERLLVAHFRYAAQQTKSECNVEDVCKLIRSTGFVAAVVESGILVTPARRPALYPVEYFRRAQLCPNHLHLIVGRLRSDDLYNQIAVYPMPNQRSTALTSQAAILFVVLFFVPDTLTNENAIMREVSDKFFSDNHVLSVHMGLVFNLVDAWDSFRAAKSALGNALDSTRLRRVAAQHGANMQTQSDQIRSWLTEGTLTERSVLMHSHKLFALIRETNVSLRWTLLHTHTPTGGVELSGSSGRKQRQLRDTIVAEIKFDPATVLDLLLSVAQLEQSVERIYRLLCKNRTTAWNQHRMECYDRSIELSEVFAGKRPLTRIDCNVKLEQWFGQFATQLKSLELDGDDCEVSVQKIVKLSRALQQVREFRQLESHAQVKQHLTECDLALQSMLKINCIGDTFLQNLNVVCDLSYAWEIIRSYTSHMQTQIHKDANLVIKLRAVFLKLASALDVPLLRIHQANADELQHVSQFYSSELVRYVRDVLHVIPETLFRHMNAIVQLQTDTIKVLPTYVRRDQLSSYAQSNERLEVAHLTHSISLLTQGLLSMRSTLFGVIRIDASRILEDGIRRELVKQLSNAFHSTFTFAPKQRPAELARRLERLHMQMDGYRRSFEYMQDYVCVYGLKIWQEELNRVLNYHVEQECNPFLARKVLDWESLYQNSHIPIPLQRSAESGVITFVGQLVKEMIRITDPKQTTFVFQMFAWFDAKTHAEVVDKRLFKKLNRSISVVGLNGIDKVISFMVVAEIETLNKCIDDNLMQSDHWNESVHKIIDTLTHRQTVDLKFANSLAMRFIKVLTFVNECLSRIGQLQILKLCIGHELNSSCRFEANQLNHALQTLNGTILNSIRYKPEILDTNEESVLLFELSNFLEWNGITDTFSKVYTVIREPQHMEIVCFLLLLNQLPKYVYCRQTQGLIPRKAYETNDGNAFTVGLVTWLAQYTNRSCCKLIYLIGQYVNASQSESNRELNLDSIVFCVFAELMTFYAKLPKSHLQKHIPNCVLDNLHSILKTMK